MKINLRNCTKINNCHATQRIKYNEINVLVTEATMVELRTAIVEIYSDITLFCGYDFFLYRPVCYGTGFFLVEGSGPPD
jgi:hypothetical protein